MRALAWLVTAAFGLALMLHSYDRLLRGDPQAPWASGFLCIGKGGAARPFETGSRISTRLRFLPASGFVEVLLNSMAKAQAEMKATLEARLSSRVIELPADAMSLLADRLIQGRLPEPGKDELLSGAQAPHDGPVSIEGRSFRIVGVLQPSVALLTDSYLIPRHAHADTIFPEGDKAVQPVEVIDLKTMSLRHHVVVDQVTAAFPRESFVLLGPEVRSDPKGFTLYLTGQALFLLGGTGLLIGLYRWLSERVTWPILAKPLQELDRRPGLLWGVHLVYFGLFVVGAVAIYQIPAINSVLMAGVQGQLQSKGNGALAVAGRAYGSGNMIYAAVVTFLVNFFLGSVVMITLPSMIIPGCGALLALVRAALWGVLLGPTQVTLAFAMQAHSGTLLLEGEGYILATFFALLIPVYLLGSGTPPPKATLADSWESEPELTVQPPGTVWSRFKHALSLNLQGNVLVAVVLAVAACYEAFEVISMARG